VLERVLNSWSAKSEKVAGHFAFDHSTTLLYPDKPKPLNE